VLAYVGLNAIQRSSAEFLQIDCNESCASRSLSLRVIHQQLHAGASVA
jgi:hypothetical protein